MQNSNNDGFEHPDHAQAAVEQDRFLLVASPLSTHPNAPAEALPTLDARPRAVGKPQAGALENGDVSATTMAALAARDMAPDIATGRTPQHPSWQAYFAQQPAPPPADASAQVPMASKLQTEIGGALYRLRKGTVEPVLGIRKDLLGFRQCSRRGVQAAGGAWCRVCMACNLKRLQSLTMGSGCLLLPGGTGQGVCDCAQVPHGQKRFTHQDALGYAHVVFLGKWSTTDSP
jgi:hypothetical protein